MIVQYIFENVNILFALLVKDILNLFADFSYSFFMVKCLYRQMVYFGNVKIYFWICKPANRQRNEKTLVWRLEQINVRVETVKLHRQLNRICLDIQTHTKMYRHIKNSTNTLTWKGLKGELEAVYTHGHKSSQPHVRPQESSKFIPASWLTWA